MKYIYVITGVKEPISYLLSKFSTPTREVVELDYKLDSKENFTRLQDEGSFELIYSFSLIEEIDDREKVICKCGNDEWEDMDNYRLSFEPSTMMHETEFSCTANGCNETYKVVSKYKIITIGRTTLYKEGSNE